MLSSTSRNENPEMTSPPLEGHNYEALRKEPASSLRPHNKPLRRRNKLLNPQLRLCPMLYLRLGTSPLTIWLGVQNRGPARKGYFCSGVTFTFSGHSPLPPTPQKKQTHTHTQKLVDPSPKAFTTSGPLAHKAPPRPVRAAAAARWPANPPTGHTLGANPKATNFKPILSCSVTLEKREALLGKTLLVGQPRQKKWKKGATEQLRIFEATFKVEDLKRWGTKPILKLGYPFSDSLRKVNNF